MNYYEFCLKWSAEGRAWVSLLMPVFISFVAGWHLPTPPWVKGKDQK